MLTGLDYFYRREAGFYSCKICETTKDSYLSFKDLQVASNLFHVYFVHYLLQFLKMASPIHKLVIIDITYCRNNYNTSMHVVLDHVPLKMFILEK
jgi:hypothetical protein